MLKELAKFVTKQLTRHSVPKPKEEIKTMAFTGTVQLFNNGVAIPGATSSVDDSGNFNVSLSTLPAGSNNITAVYTGPEGTGTSPVDVQVVNGVSTINVSLTSTPNPSNVGDNVVFSGQVTSGPSGANASAPPLANLANILKR